MCYRYNNYLKYIYVASLCKANPSLHKQGVLCTSTTWFVLLLDSHILYSNNFETNTTFQNTAIVPCTLKYTWRGASHNVLFVREQPSIVRSEARDVHRHWWELLLRSYVLLCCSIGFLYSKFSQKLLIIPNNFWYRSSFAKILGNLYVRINSLPGRLF